MTVNSRLVFVMFAGRLVYVVVGMVLCTLAVGAFPLPASVYQVYKPALTLPLHYLLSHQAWMNFALIWQLVDRALSPNTTFANQRSRA